MLHYKEKPTVDISSSQTIMTDNDNLFVTPNAKSKGTKINKDLVYDETMDMKDYALYKYGFVIDFAEIIPTIIQENNIKNYTMQQTIAMTPDQASRMKLRAKASGLVTLSSQYFFL